MWDELDVEAAATRKALARVPEDKLAWRPHPKSMTLGQLALHIAMIPAAICQLASVDEFDASAANFTPPQPESHAQIMQTLEASLDAAEKYLSSLDGPTGKEIWRMSANGRQVLAMPRERMLRAILLNHWYHHRGQLSVYLRLLDVPVPVIYGRSADENPFS
jgi:uncharacterized damage-inducible protein DinB